MKDLTPVPHTTYRTALKRSMMTLMLWAAIALGLLASPTLAQDGWRAVDPSGIHYAVPRNVLHPDRWRTELLQTHDCSIPCIVELDDRLSALHLRYKWDQLNPQQGVYNFEDLRQVLELIRAADKKATLIVMAGKYTPGWVFSAGAAQLKVTAGTPESSVQPRVPLPWDPVFLNSYVQMVDALSGYLRQYPDLYRTVVLVKNGAVVVHSGETRLMPPRAFGVQRHQDSAKESLRTTMCHDWARAGYSEGKVLEAIRITNARIAAAFPDQYLGLAFVGGSNRFPTVNSAGECVHPKKNKTLRRIVQQTVNNYGPRAIVNNTVFTAENGVPPILRWALKNGGQVGVQLNRKRVGCHERQNGFCSDENFRETITLGVASGFTFIEVHDGNIHRNQDTLRAANTALEN